MFEVTADECKRSLGGDVWEFTIQFKSKLRLICVLWHFVHVQIQLVQPGQIQLQGGQTLQLQGQQGQPQQIIIQQPQAAITAGQNQVLNSEQFNGKSI